MSKRTLQVAILFTSSKAIEPQLTEVKFDKYRISSIPTARESVTDTAENLLLEFTDLWKNDQRCSNPEKEGDYVLSLLSLILQTKVEFDSTKINNVQVTMRKKRSAFLIGKIKFPSDFEGLLKKLHSLDLDLLRQFLRSCSAYRTALFLVDDNPTLSFFLLVTAIEAISNRVIGGEKLSGNFKKFILKYLPISLKEEFEDKKLLHLLIEQAYVMRSAFTHGGTEISVGTISADRLERKYVKHYIKGREVCSPSLRWFERVVRAVLLEFLRDQKIVEEKESKLADLAIEEAIIYLKSTKAIEVSQGITTKDVDLNFRND